MNRTALDERPDLFLVPWSLAPAITPCSSVVEHGLHPVQPQAATARMARVEYSEVTSSVANSIRIVDHVRTKRWAWMRLQIEPFSSLSQQPCTGPMEGGGPRRSPESWLLMK